MPESNTIHKISGRKALRLHWIDVAIVVIYLLLTVAVGFWISKRASGDMRAYVLGGNKLPWYALGLSNASGMFDVAGTMWMVYLLFVYGLKSIFIPWLWPAFNQIFLMVFLAAWLRRSGVMTGAEWIRFRFGEGVGSHLSHLIIVAFALITVLGYMAFGFLGIGKLAAAFLPFQFSVDPQINDKIYALILVAATTIYAVKGGMYSVVLTEVLQFFVMIAACFGVAYVAMNAVSPEQVAAATPAGWADIQFGWNLGLDWSMLLPAANDKIAADGYSLFTIFMMLVVFKGIFQSLAGPAPNYDMQRVLSAKNPEEASKMSAVVNVVLMFPRYLMIAGLTILALVYFSDDLAAMGDKADFEAILPFALSNFIPMGLLGIILAGLLAAFMSSFAASLNAAPAYVVNDVYRRYIRPDAPEKHYVKISYVVAILFVVIGCGIGLFLQSIDNLVFWITSGLYGGYTAANVLKWYWWRLNGVGYFCGMVSGIGFALLLGLPDADNPIFSVLHLLYNDALGLGVERFDALNAFPALFVACILMSVLGSLLTPPDDMEMLKRFYLKTRPWGFWKPVQAALQNDGSVISPNNQFSLDMFNVVVGIIWQTALIAAPIFFVLKSWHNFSWALACALVCSAILKLSWWDRLAKREAIIESEVAEFERKHGIG